MKSWMFCWRLVLVLFVASNGMLQSRAETAFETNCARLTSSREPDAARLAALFKLDWDYTMRENPEFATEAGYPGLNDRWTDSSMEAIERRKRELQAPFKVIASIDRSKLGAADRLNYDLFRRNLQDAIEGTRFKGEYLAISQLGGIHQGAAQTMEISPRARIKDYEDMIWRLNRLPTAVDQTIVRLKQGLENGITAPRITLRDPRFYHTNAQELLRDYRDIAKRIDPELIRFFGKLPRLPYGVLPIPSYAERSQTTAYYQPGSVQAGRPGYFYANTYAVETRPKWEMEALTSHEAVPGHHLQISLAQEMEHVPEFRKYSGYTAFIEGWGLYAEGLTEEMGLYKDPYMKFGQLTYEMWRAIRLVVDTGIHSMGWTRQQAIDYFLANTSKTEHDVTVEVDRYIVWPGQALAYKIGQMKIKELRADATKELAGRFDIRAFHDQVMANGALPLDVLESRIKDWVRAQEAARD